MQFIPYLVELQEKGQLPLEDLVTCYSMHDFAKAIADTEKGLVLKAVLKWDSV